MDYIKYTTEQGERFDQIAQKLFGEPGRWKDVINANPTLALVKNFDAGVVIRVPILQTATPTGVAANLPPWKR
jgi:phage tail protein X